MAVAGHLCALYETGTSTSMTAEATTNVSGKIYRITDRSKRLIDPGNAVTVLDNASPVAASNIESIDYLFGKVTFDSGYSVTGPVTITGNYMPLVEIATVKSFTFSASTGLLDITVMNQTANNRVYLASLFDCQASITLLDDATPELEAELQAGSAFYFVIGTGGDPADADIDDHIRARVKVSDAEQSGEVDGLVEGQINLMLDAVESVEGYNVSYGVDL